MWAAQPIPLLKGVGASILDVICLTNTQHLSMIKLFNYLEQFLIVLVENHKDVEKCWYNYFQMYEGHFCLTSDRLYIKGKSI